MWLPEKILPTPFQAATDSMKPSELTTLLKGSQVACDTASRFELSNDFTNIPHAYFMFKNLLRPAILDRDYVSLFS